MREEVSGVGDLWVDRLSEYLDGELPDAERVELEAHLGSCDDCARTLGELRLVVARARSLDDRRPAADLWQGIAARLDAGSVEPMKLRRRRTISFTIPQLAAAAIAVITFSATGAFLALRVRSMAVDPVVMTVEAQPMTPVVVGFDAARYDAALFTLEQVLASGRQQLDTATVRVLEENLRIIDRAIAEARAALAADPANAYLNSHLAQTMLRKAALLKHAAALVAASS